jgi:hypothetical protein
LLKQPASRAVESRIAKVAERVMQPGSTKAKRGVWLADR